MAVVHANILGYAYTATKASAAHGPRIAALLEVFLIGLSGYIFARNGTLTRPTLKSLSLISVNLLTPALMFSKMTETLEPQMLVELWNAPVFYFVYGGFSLAWSRIGGRVLRLDPEYGRLCDVATFFSNTNTLPVSLIKSIALSAGSQFLLKDADDTPFKVAARGVSYAMIFATLNNILRWSFGVALLGGLNNTAASRSAFNSVSATPAQAPRMAALSRTSSADELTPLCLGEPAAPVRGQGEGPAARALALAERLGRALLARLRSAWRSAQPCLTPPVYAIVAAFVVISIEPLHDSFRSPDSLLYTLWTAIDMCGDACVPLILISLGGQLGLMAAEKRRHNGDERSSSSSNSSNSSNSSSAERCASTPESEDTSINEATRASSVAMIPAIVLRSATGSGSGTVELSQSRPHTPGAGRALGGELPRREQRRGVALVLLGRFVVVPALAVALITTLRVAFPALLPIMDEDPVYMLTLLILSSTPPAINLITVSQATGKFEAEAAQILFYGYVLGIFVLAVEVSGFLWLTNALERVV
ncbi:hypothetical protein H4R18_003331 [Coemansia javaensis]|uniref:Auxin efflux carrier n=1 Tax=Coemansia javaensis TaxID=2761396 RepID=A0A9W8HCF4_9FUNG|nr:hypothetical protein H4R18_003331 [Coemansia javaensis]